MRSIHGTPMRLPPRYAPALLAATLLLASGARLHAQHPALVGCWALDVGTWEPELESRDPGFPPPAWFALRGRRGGDEGQAIYGGTWNHRERHWKWSRLRGGGVAIVFATGFAGYHLRLEPRGERLEGTIEAFGDVGQRARASAVATRASCRRR